MNEPLNVERLADAIHVSQQCMAVGRWTARDELSHRELHVIEATRIAGLYAAALEPRQDAEPALTFTRDCPGCGQQIAADDTHWSLFPEPAGAYLCPVVAR